MQKAEELTRNLKDEYRSPRMPSPKSLEPMHNECSADGEQAPEHSSTVDCKVPMDVKSWENLARA